MTRARLVLVLVGRLLWPSLVFACVLMLTGCSSSGAAPPGITTAVFTVVTTVWRMRALGNDPLLRNQIKGDTFKDFVTEFGEHVKFFVRWRAEHHLKTESDTDKVSATVAAEYDQVRAYVAAKIGLDPGQPAPLVKGTDLSPAHLDLDNFLRPRVTSPNPVFPTLKLTEETKRWARANAIIWRAAAVEPLVWQPSFSSAAMHELLDRRLRVIERLWYQIDQRTTGGSLVPSAAAPHGPWLDGSRVRAFEYPELDANQLRDAIGAANIGPGKPWREDTTSGILVYNESTTRWHTRIRNAAAPSFSAPPAPPAWPDDYGYALERVDAAAAIDRLFEPAEDWWDRSWLYCDEVLAAVHLESLRFGKRRRLQDNDASFDSMIASHDAGWAGLRPAVSFGGPDWRLLADDDGKPPSEPRLFSNGAVTHIQLGDHVIFFNSIMYGLLSNGAWSLENAVVVDLRSDWRSNDYGDGIKLMGHGTSETTDLQFRQELAGGLNYMLDQARLKVNAAPAGTVDVPWLRQAAPLVRWAPYGESWVDASGAPQAPWWLRVPYAQTGDWIGRAIGRDATLRTLPDAVEADPSPSGGYVPPPAAGGGPADACYFPLWVPAQNGRWRGYLARRKAGQVGTTFRLEPTKFAGGNIPGLVAPREFTPGGQLQFVYAARPHVSR